jgi:hypothetical protein
MTIELIDINVREWQAHPRLPGRRTGRVRAVLSENGNGINQTHELSIPVWADLAPSASEGDIDMALMLKAAQIVGRLKAQLARSLG